MEQLTKAVQQLNQQPNQSKDTARGPTVACNDSRVPPANRYDRGPYRQVGPTRPRQARDHRFSIDKEGISPEIVIKFVFRSLWAHVPISSRTLIVYGPKVKTPQGLIGSFG